jgi:hypothetical protein
MSVTQFSFSINGFRRLKQKEKKETPIALHDNNYTSLLLGYYTQFISFDGIAKIKVA